MTPAKKKKTTGAKRPARPGAASEPVKEVPVAAPAPAVVVPPPVLTAKQQRFWKVIRTSTLIGILFLVLGVGVLGGHWFYHREWHTPSFVGSMILMLLGALLLDPTSVKDALGTLGGAAKDVLPFTKKNDPPTGGAG